MNSYLTTVLFLVGAGVLGFMRMEYEEVSRRRYYTWFRFRWAEVDREVARYCKLEKKLERWLDIRPFLYVGTCPYARGLVLQMIESYEHIVRLAPGVRDETIFETLYHLLNENPPRHDPPVKKGSLPIGEPFSFDTYAAEVSYLRLGFCRRWLQN